MTSKLHLDVEIQIIQWLKGRGYCTWRCNLGGARRSNQMAGFPHIGAVHRQLQGRLIGVVVKPAGSLVTEAQRAWHRALASEGALVIVASGVGDVAKALLEATPVAPIDREAIDPRQRAWGERDGF